MDDLFLKIKSLEEQIEKYNKAYYDENKSLISDYDYDLLKKELEKLREQYKQGVNSGAKKEQNTTTSTNLFGDDFFIENKVGYSPNGKFKKIQHKQRMASLANALTQEEFNDFVEKTTRFLNTDVFPECVCELKIDGLSFSAMYNFGKLKYIATRGDGLIGEDVSVNAMQIDGFPQILPNSSPASQLEEFEVRGEIYMPKSAFDDLNDKLPEKEKFSNPRNAASGTLRQLNPDIVKQRRLSYYAYAIGVSTKEICDTQMQTLSLLEELGFFVNRHKILAKNAEDIYSFHKHIAEIRYQIECDIDGIVVKVNDFSIQKQLGMTAHHPRWAIAYKFSGLTALTRLNGIVNQVGRTGIITPVAELTPVNIGGVIVRRATLHNYDEIERLNLHIGDIVEVKRSGDVIPKIIEVKETSDDAIKIEKPKFCPCCGSKLIRNNDDVAIICPNLNNNCKDQIIERIIHFSSRKALDINGLGAKTIERFYNLGILKGVLDIFNLKKHVQILENLDDFGVKSTQNLLLAIENAKNCYFNKLLYALGIADVGENIAKILAKHYKNFQELLSDKENFSLISGINGLGDVIIKGLKQYFNDDANLKLVN